MVAIITYIPDDTPIEFCARAMRNIDEQSVRTWHHYLLCETEEALRRIRSLISLRSPEYSAQITLLTTNIIPTDSDYDFVAIHPVRDFWSYKFIETMTSVLEDSPVIVAGVLSQYTTVQETIRNKTISVDRTTPGPTYTRSLLLPTLPSIESARYIQGFYHYDVLQDGDSCHMHPLSFNARILAERDIITIPDICASYSEREEDVLQFQQARNDVYRTYPLLRPRYE